jgi:hypothetical protein
MMAAPYFSPHLRQQSSVNWQSSSQVNRDGNLRFGKALLMKLIAALQVQRDDSNDLLSSIATGVHIR